MIICLLLEKRKRENAQLREALDAAMEGKQAGGEIVQEAGRAVIQLKKVAKVTQAAEERAQESEAQFQRDAASIREESDTAKYLMRKVRQNENASRKFDAHLVPGTPLILFEHPDSPEDLAKTEQA